MFYDYSISTRHHKVKSKSSGSTYRKPASSIKSNYWSPQKKKCKDLEPKWTAKEIPRDVVMELFNIHQNRTPQKCFEQFIPLYPKSSSLLFGKYKVPYPSESFFKEWLQRLEQSPYKRLITKIYIECDVELKIFNEINKMNEYPMIPEAPKQERPIDILMEDLLLFLTNIRLRDILKLKKNTYQMWTEDYARSIAKSNADELLEIEALYMPENKEMGSSNSSTADSNDSCRDNPQGDN